MVPLGEKPAEVVQMCGFTHVAGTVGRHKPAGYLGTQFTGPHMDVTLDYLHGDSAFSIICDPLLREHL